MRPPKPRRRILAAERKLTEYAIITDALIPNRLAIELRGSGRGLGELFAKAFGESARTSRVSLSDEVPRVPPGRVQFRPYEGASGSPAPIYRLAPEQAEALTDLFEAVERVVADAFARGVDRGSKPMLRLAMGEITADAYNSEIRRDSDEAARAVNTTLEMQSKKKKTGD